MPRGVSFSAGLPEDLDDVAGRVSSGKSLPIVEAMGILSELDAALESVDRQNRLNLMHHRSLLENLQHYLLSLNFL